MLKMIWAVGMGWIAYLTLREVSVQKAIDVRPRYGRALEAAPGANCLSLLKGACDEGAVKRWACALFATSSLGKGGTVLRPFRNRWL